MKISVKEAVHRPEGCLSGMVSDQSVQLFVWARETEEKVIFSEEKDVKTIPRRRDMGLIRKLDFGDRGAIDCIQVHGSQVFTSFDDCGSVVISDFW